MKIDTVSTNARRRAFLVELGGGIYPFPFARCNPKPSSSDPVVAVTVDSELGEEAFVMMGDHFGYSIKSCASKGAQQVVIAIVQGDQQGPQGAPIGDVAQSGGGGGLVISEQDDAAQAYASSLAYSEYLEFTVTPLLTIEDAVGPIAAYLG